ncbi:MAG: zinc finger-like domain-containing protein [Planctomycetes bacterium]|nr:zinc finger-like domain-containing protein [Planctomycetota bacterium]
MRRTLLGLVLVLPTLSRAQSTAPALPPTPEIAAVRVGLADVLARERARRAELESAARAQHGGELSRDDYARCFTEARTFGLGLHDELLLETADPAARVEILRSAAGYPELRPARECLQDALGLAPNGRTRATVLWALADEVWVDEPERGFVLLSRAIDADPTWADARVQRAWIAADAGRWGAVFDDLARALELAPERAGVLGVLRARFEARRGDFDAAFEAARSERMRAEAPRELVVRATLLEALALLALDSPIEARAVLRPVLAEADAHFEVLDFLPDDRVLALRRLADELDAEQRRAAELAKAKPAGEKVRVLGIDAESAEERNQREAAELRAAEIARAKARAERAASRALSKFVDVPCDACGTGGVTSARCAHCVGSGREPYKTRKRTERELQGAHWVVRTIEEKVPCMTCDGVGVVGAVCPVCHGDGLRSVERGR